MEQKFKVWIDGNYYYEDKEYEVEIDLSDEDMEKIRKVVKEYDGNLSRGLMPVFKNSSKDLYQLFYDTIYPEVFLELFLRDDMFEPEPGDENRSWDESDFDYLIKTYGDNYYFDDAYIVYIPDEMMPPKIKLSKGMVREDILKYIRRWNSTREDVFDWITTRHVIPNQMHDTLYGIIEKHLLNIAENALENPEEGTLAVDNYNPFARLITYELADEIYKEYEIQV